MNSPLFHPLRTAFSTTLNRVLPLAVLLAATTAAFSAAPPKKEEAEDPNAPVSYFKKVRPVFQANCQGCHQPAKAKGGYVMTDFAKLLRGGDDAEKEGAAIVPGQADKSHLMKQITPVNGEAEMPPKKKPLRTSCKLLNSTLRAWMERSHTRLRTRTPRVPSRRYRECLPFPLTD